MSMTSVSATTSSSNSSHPSSTAHTSNSSPTKAGIDTFDCEAEVAYYNAFCALGFDSTFSIEIVYDKPDWPHQPPVRCALRSLEGSFFPEPEAYDSHLEEAIERYGFDKATCHEFAEIIRGSGAPGHRVLVDWLQTFLETTWKEFPPGPMPLAPPTSVFGELRGVEFGDKRVFLVRFEPRQRSTTVEQFSKIMSETVLNLLRTSDQRCLR